MGITIKTTYFSVNDVVTISAGPMARRFARVRRIVSADGCQVEVDVLRTGNSVMSWTKDHFTQHRIFLSKPLVSSHHIFRLVCRSSCRIRDRDEEVVIFPTTKFGDTQKGKLLEKWVSANFNLSGFEDEEAQRPHVFLEGGGRAKISPERIFVPSRIYSLSLGDDAMFSGWRGRVRYIYPDGTLSLRTEIGDHKVCLGDLKPCVDEPQTAGCSQDLVHDAPEVNFHL